MRQYEKPFMINMENSVLDIIQSSQLFGAQGNDSSNVVNGDDLGL